MGVKCKIVQTKIESLLNQSRFTLKSCLISVILLVLLNRVLGHMVNREAFRKGTATVN